jgi:hypothetical protein
MHSGAGDCKSKVKKTLANAPANSNANGFNLFDIKFVSPFKH